VQLHTQCPASDGQASITTDARSLQRRCWCVQARTRASCWTTRTSKRPCGLPRGATTSIAARSASASRGACLPCFPCSAWSCIQCLYRPCSALRPACCPLHRHVLLVCGVACSVYVPESMYDAFVAKAAERACARTIGDQWSGCDQSCQTSKEQFDRVLQ